VPATPAATQSEYLTLAQVGELLQLDRRTVLRLIEDQNLTTGILIIERPERVRPAKRRYRTVRIHRSVLSRLAGGAR